MTNIRVKESTRKRPVTKRQRGVLPNGGKPWVNTGCSDQVKAELLRYFPEVELIFNPISKKVAVYRVLNRTQISKNQDCSPDDLLMHEFTLKAPVGSWLVTHMLQHDGYRKYGGKDNMLTGYMKEDKEYEYQKEKAEDKVYQDIVLDYQRVIEKRWGEGKSIIVPSNYKREV